MDNRKEPVIYVGMDMCSSIGVMEDCYEADWEELEPKWESIKQSANVKLRAGYAYPTLMDMAIRYGLEFGYIENSIDAAFEIEPIPDLDDICIHITKSMYQATIGSEISDDNWQKLCGLNYTSKGDLDQLLDEATAEACGELGLIDIE